MNRTVSKLKSIDDICSRWERQCTKIRSVNLVSNGSCCIPQTICQISQATSQYFFILACFVPSYIVLGSLKLIQYPQNSLFLSLQQLALCFKLPCKAIFQFRLLQAPRWTTRKVTIVRHQGWTPRGTARKAAKKGLRGRAQSIDFDSSE